MRNHKECRGCTLRHDVFNLSPLCVYQDANVAEHCPCLSCLIKPICDKHDCNLRSRKYTYSVQKSIQALNEELRQNQNEKR